MNSIKFFTALQKAGVKDSVGIGIDIDTSCRPSAALGIVIKRACASALVGTSVDTSCRPSAALGIVIKRACASALVGTSVGVGG